MPPEGWTEALGHLEECEECRVEALRADPSLVFQLSMPEIEVGETEIADMKRAVVTLRQGLELAARDADARPERQASSLRFWGASAAAVVLAIGVGYGAASTASRGHQANLETPGPTVASEAHTFREPQGAAEFGLWASVSTDELAEDVFQPPILPVDWRQAPILEEVSNPEARVSFLTSPGEEVAVVMVIDPTLDV